MSEAVERPLAPRVGEAMVWNTLAAPLKAAATLLTSVVVARMLGARDYGVSLWSLLMFEAFLRKIMGARSAEKFKVA